MRAGRTWAVRVVFAAIALHIVAGILLPVIIDVPLLEDYHQATAAAFWGAAPIPAAALALQRWWMALFGPTVQATALWMGALAWIGARHRMTFAWGALIVGLLL